MKILYVAMKYDYGDPKRGGYSLEHYNFYESLVAYQGGKHKVIYFPFDEVMHEVGKEQMNARLLKTVYEQKPDLCFFVLFNDEINKETLKEIKEKSGAITYNWYCDDHWRFHNFSKHYAPLFHWVSTTDNGSLPRYKKAGLTNVIKTQWACSPSLYKRYDVPYQYDVSFIGQPYGKRPEIIQALKDAGVKVECFGPGWPNGRIFGEAMIKAFCASKINLNFARSSGAFNLKGIARIFINKDSAGKYHMNPIGTWLDQLRAYIDRLNTYQIKTRNFEVPGSGALLMTDRADNVEEYFVPGKEIILFTDTADLIEKAKYYLAHDEEREAIRKAGYERTVREHTYANRFDHIFKVMGVENK